MLPIMAQAQIKLQPKVAMSYGHEKVRLMDEQVGSDVITISYGY